MSRRNGERTGAVKGEEMTMADYSEFPIHAQDGGTRRTLDLLQG